MTLNRLKATEINTLPDGYYNDGNGLYLRVRYQGKTREYLFRGTVNGKQTFRSLGSTKTLTLKEARQKAKTFSLVPIKKEATFNEVWKESLDEVAFLKQWKKPTSYTENQRYIQRTLPYIGSLTISKITKDHLLAYLRPLWEKNSYEGERTRSILEAVFSRLLSKKLISSNPAKWDDNLSLDLPHWKEVHETVHRKSLDWKEVPSLMKTLYQSNLVAKYLLMFVIATALRVTECRTLKWSYLRRNEEMGDYLEIPAENRKRNRKKTLPDHILPLTPYTMKILSLVPRTSEYIFTNSKNEMIGITVPTHALRHQLKVDATTHGFRTCFRTWGAIKKEDFASCELILSHSLSSIGTASTRCYFNTDLYEERKNILYRWNKYIFPMDFLAGLA